MEKKEKSDKNNILDRNITDVIPSLKENKCKYYKTLEDVHSKIKNPKDYWLFTEVFCLLHNNNDFCNCK